MQRVITDRKEGKGLAVGSGFTHVTSLFWFQPWVPFFPESHLCFRSPCWQSVVAKMRNNSCLLAREFTSRKPLKNQYKSEELQQEPKLISRSLSELRAVWVPTQQGQPSHDFGSASKVKMISERQLACWFMLGGGVEGTQKQNIKKMWLIKS